MRLRSETFGGTGRQAGSSFKAFTLAAAMHAGFDLNSTWYGPGTITIPDTDCYTNGAPWQLSNASDSEAGYFSLKSATANSVNTVFAQVAAQLGPEKVVDMAHLLGIRSHLDPVCSITLGVEAVNPLEMTNAYATLAAHGARRYATPLVELANHNGKPIADVSRKPKQVLDANDADLVTYALEDVVTSGTGHGGSPLRSSGGRQDRHRAGLRRRVVLRLHAAAGDVRVGGIPAGRDPDGVRGGRLPGLRRHDPGRDLARLHDGRDAGAARRVVHHPVVRGPHDRPGAPRVLTDARARRRRSRPAPPARPARPAPGPTGGTGGTGPTGPDRTHGHGSDGSHRAGGNGPPTPIRLRR